MNLHLFIHIYWNSNECEQPILVSDTVFYGMHMDENIDTDRRAVDGIHCMFSSVSVFVCVRAYDWILWYSYCVSKYTIAWMFIAIADTDLSARSRQ